MDELSDLIALFPDSLNGKATIPYSSGKIVDNGIETEYMFPCKGKKTFVKGKDDKRFEKYLEDFRQMVIDKRRKLYLKK